MEFGRAVMVQQIITNAAREGARKAIIPGAKTATILGDDGDPDNPGLIRQYLKRTSIYRGETGPPGLVVKVRDTNNNDLLVENAASKQPIVVVVSVPYDEVSFITGLWLSGRGLNLGAEVVMRKE